VNSKSAGLFHRSRRASWSSGPRRRNACRRPSPRPAGADGDARSNGDDAVVGQPALTSPPAPVITAT
jgi:hypothetical protein